jgi:predicted homoserine dehydrogenase-like protein
MIILDKALEKRAAEGRPIRVGMIGAGAMGRGCANQIVNAVPGMDLVAIANRTVPWPAAPMTRPGGRARSKRTR